MIVFKLLIIIVIMAWGLFLFTRLRKMDIDYCGTIKNLFEVPISWIVEKKQKRNNEKKTTSSNRYSSWLRLLISFVPIIVAGYICYKVWNMDIDSKKTFSSFLPEKTEEKTGFIKEHEKDALYQDKKVVARVTGSRIDYDNYRVYFDEIYKCNEFNIKKEALFRVNGQNLKLKFIDEETSALLDVSAPEKKLIRKNVWFEIIDEEI